ncbi:MAG: aquaporin [Chloroflexi bacterium]|nr:aquaporin [Chloroflexota bacterium]
MGATGNRPGHIRRPPDSFSTYRCIHEPGRSFGPALIHGAWDDHWLYWVGPGLGGFVAAIAYVVIFGTKEDRDKFGTINVRSD